MSKAIKAVTNAYKATVLSINRTFKAEKRLSNRLNLLKRKLNEWLAGRSASQIATLSGLYDKKANDAKAFTTQFLPWLFGTFRYDLVMAMLPSNPDGDRSPKEILKLIAEGYNFNTITPRLSDTEKVELGNVTGSEEYEGKFLGGITIFRLLQVAYGVHKYIIKEHGNGYLKKDLTEQKVLSAVKEYHEAKQAQSAKRENEQDAIVEDIAGEQPGNLTPRQLLEQLENKEMSTSDIDDYELLAEVHELASGPVKGGITRRMKALVEA